MSNDKGVIRILDWITNAMAFLAGVLILVVTGLITASVISRVTGGNGMPWSLELTEYALVYMCFLSVPWVLKQDAHVRVDFVVERIRRRSTTAYLNVQRVTDVVVGLVCIVMTYYGLRIAIDLWQRGVVVTSILNWAKAPIVVIIPIGFLVMLAQLIRVNVQRERNRRSGTEVAQGGER